MNRIILVCLMAVALSGCGPIQTPGDVAREFLQENRQKIATRMADLAQQESNLKAENQECKKQQIIFLGQLNDAQLAMVKFATWEYQKYYEEAIGKLMSGETPALVTASNPRGLFIDWWNYLPSERGPAPKFLHYQRQRRIEFLKNSLPTEQYTKLEAIWKKKYEIRDAANDIFAEKQRLKYTLRQLPSQAWEIEDTSGLYYENHPRTLNPQQEATLKIMLDEQNELLYRQQSIFDWLDYQKEFGYSEVQREPSSSSSKE